jgi:hypothetical protein
VVPSVLEPIHRNAHTFTEKYPFGWHAGGGLRFAAVHVDTAV